MQPMREPTYFTLAALLEGPLHGYAIAKRAEQLSDGRVRLAAGTLYAALDRLLEQGLVAVEGEEVVSGRARRYYRITGAGGEAGRAGVWAEGCALAALVLLLLAATGAAFVLGWDVWYARLGMHGPIQDFHPAPLAGLGLARVITAAALPWAAALAICRGRRLVAIAGPLLAAGLYLSGVV